VHDEPARSHRCAAAIARSRILFNELLTLDRKHQQAKISIDVANQHSAAVLKASAELNQRIAAILPTDPSRHA
jgi:hypothetical protein